MTLTHLTNIVYQIPQINYERTPSLKAFMNRKEYRIGNDQLAGIVR